MKVRKLYKLICLFRRQGRSCQEKVSPQLILLSGAHVTNLQLTSKGKRH